MPIHIVFHCVLAFIHLFTYFGVRHSNGEQWCIVWRPGAMEMHIVQFSV